MFFDSLQLFLTSGQLPPTIFQQSPSVFHFPRSIYGSPPSLSHFFPANFQTLFNCFLPLSKCLFAPVNCFVASSHWFPIPFKRFGLRPSVQAFSGLPPSVLRFFANDIGHISSNYRLPPSVFKYVCYSADVCFQPPPCLFHPRPIFFVVGPIASKHFFEYLQVSFFSLQAFFNPPQMFRMPYRVAWMRIELLWM